MQKYDLNRPILQVKSRTMTQLPQVNSLLSAVSKLVQKPSKLYFMVYTLAGCLIN